MPTTQRPRSRAKSPSRPSAGKLSHFLNAAWPSKALWIRSANNSDGASPSGPASPDNWVKADQKAKKLTRPSARKNHVATSWWAAGFGNSPDRKSGRARSFMGARSGIFQWWGSS